MLTEKNDVQFIKMMFICLCDLRDKHYILKLERQRDNNIYNIHTKRIKINESNPTYLWHCRLEKIWDLN